MEAKGFLFIGGPAHGMTYALPVDTTSYRIVIPEPVNWQAEFSASSQAEVKHITYTRRRMANRGARQVRSVFAPADMDPREVERQLIDHVMGMWVNADPDGSTE